MQGRNALQTSDALDAAGVQLGPNVAAPVVELLSLVRPVHRRHQLARRTGCPPRGGHPQGVRRQPHPAGGELQQVLASIVRTARQRDFGPKIAGHRYGYALRNRSCPKPFRCTAALLIGGPYLPAATCSPTTSAVDVRTS